MSAVWKRQIGNSCVVESQKDCEFAPLSPFTCFIARAVVTNSPATSFGKKFNLNVHTNSQPTTWQQLSHIQECGCSKDELLNLKVSIRMRKKGDLGSSELQPQPTLGFAEWSQREKISSQRVWRNCLIDGVTDQKGNNNSNDHWLQTIGRVYSWMERSVFKRRPNMKVQKNRKQLHFTV